MSQTDKAIVEGCLDGRADGFRHLVSRYQRPVMAHLSGRLRPQSRVEEAAQEAFVRAYFNLRKLRTRDSFFSWLLGIANHVAHEMIRRERAEKRLAEEQMGNCVDPVEPAAEPTGDALQQAVSALADPLREVILLRFYADCSCGEIAQRLQLPIGTVTKRLSRAYAELRKRLPADRGAV